MKLCSMTVAAAALTLCTACEKVEGVAEVPAKPVKIERAHTLEREPRARYSASILADEQVTLSFKAGGYLDAVAQRRGSDGRLQAIKPGDVVRAGETLARVRDAEYRERVAQSNSTLREAEAARQKARLDLDRADALFAVQSLTRPDLDAAQAAFEASEARLASARAQLALAEIALRECALVSPISGVVVERRVEAGTLVGSGIVGFVVARVSPVKAMFGVPDLFVQHIALGTELDVATEAFGTTRFSGRVTGISPAADQQSRVFNVEVTVPNQDGRLRPGMIGRVDIATGPASAAAETPGSVAVPLVAVVQSTSAGSGYAVFVVDGPADRTVARARAVSLGDVRGNAVAVTHGLSVGERVIVSGASLLADGDRIRIIQ